MSFPYTLHDLQTDFPTEEACLTWILEWLYPDGVFCKTCDKIRPHYKDRKRPSYSCAYCGDRVHPMAGTIFHKSRTPLTKWFYAIYIMSATRCGVSAMQMKRELGVTYKCAFRMMHQIRKLMEDDDSPFDGEVEVDETYIHPKPGRRSSAKPHKSQVVFGMVERDTGRAKVRHVKSSGARVLQPIIQKEVKRGNTIISDEYASYTALPRLGYRHSTVNHSRWQFVDCWVYTQNIENLWSHIKRGITGVYRHVSPKYLQAYVNEYAFRYSHRNDYQPMFWAIIGRIDKVKA